MRCTCLFSRCHRRWNPAERARPSGRCCCRYVEATKPSIFVSDWNFKWCRYFSAASDATWSGGSCAHMETRSMIFLEHHRGSYSPFTWSISYLCWQCVVTASALLGRDRCMDTCQVTSFDSLLSQDWLTPRPVRLVRFAWCACWSVFRLEKRIEFTVFVTSAVYFRQSSSSRCGGRFDFQNTCMGSWNRHADRNSRIAPRFCSLSTQHVCVFVIIVCLYDHMQQNAW